MIIFASYGILMPFFSKQSQSEFTKCSNGLFGIYIVFTIQLNNKAKSPIFFKWDFSL